MGFSANLQGKLAHEALLSRQDTELRLLDSMKRCIVLKVKCDRDYAVALSSVAAQGLKFDRSDELSGKYMNFVSSNKTRILIHVWENLEWDRNWFTGKQTNFLKLKYRLVYPGLHLRSSGQFFAINFTVNYIPNTFLV